MAGSADILLPTRVPAAPGPLSFWRADAASRCGRSHASNEDAFLVAEEAGLYCVADGLGGHCDGQLASRSVASILSRTVPAAPPLTARIAAAERALGSINAALIAEARKIGPGALIGATVACLLTSDRFGACLWAGDSRIYLLREDRLFQLTTDHVSIARRGAKLGTVVTRAVGARPELALDRVVFSLAPGDVFLLCSDGVSKFTPASTIHEVLSDLSLSEHAAADALNGEAVANGSRDDVTAVVVRFAGPAGLVGPPGAP